MKNPFKNKSTIRIGFEVECVVDMPNMPQINEASKDLKIRTTYFKGNRDRFLKFRKEIFSLHSKIRIGADGSIDRLGFSPYASTCEIKTPPLPPKQSMELLNKVFDVVNKYGGTNTSCGFHVNLSSTKKTEMARFNPIAFSSSKLWDKMLKEFKRKSNTYCRPTFSFKKNTSKVTMIRRFSQIIEDKYHCVNFSNFGNGMTKSSRVEIRGMGNQDYSKKYEKIANYVCKIENLFKHSCAKAAF